jgi:hypothetical protein
LEKYTTIKANTVSQYSFNSGKFVGNNQTNENRNRIDARHIGNHQQDPSPVSGVIEVFKRNSNTN